MSTALELLLGAKGENSVASLIGKWRVYISKQVDALAQGGLILPDYGWAKRASSDQAGVTAPTSIDLNVVGVTRGISYANSRWTLQPSTTYLLRAFGYFQNFSDATGGFMDVKFTDDANNPLQVGQADSPQGRFRPNTSTAAHSTAAGLEMIYKTPADPNSPLCIVKLRIVQGSGSADVPQNGFMMTVEEIPGGV